jgi:hypothetical protein
MVLTTMHYEHTLHHRSISVSYYSDDLSYSSCAYMYYGLDEIAFLWMDIRYGGWEFGLCVLLNIVLKKNAISFLRFKKMRCILTFSKLTFKICTFFGINIPTIIRQWEWRRKGGSMKEKYHIDEGGSIWQAKYIKIKYNYTKRISYGRWFK